MKSHETALSLLKSLLTKACFTVGLCTTAYWSVAKIHHAMSPSAPLQGESTSLRDKVEILTQDQKLGSAPAHGFMAQALNHVVHAEPATIAEAPKPLATGIENAEATAEAAPSMTPSEALVQGQEANPEQVPYAQPVYPNYPYGYSPFGQSGENAQAESAKSKSDSGSAAAIDPMSGQPYGQTVNGQMITPPAGVVYGGFNIANSGNTVNVTSNLTPQDVQWLIASSVKASIPVQQFAVAGNLANGSPTQNYSVFSTRWSLEEGVKSEGALFTVRPNSGGAPVQIEVSFNIQTRNSTLEPVQITMKPTDSNARNDVRNGRAVRIYTFQGPNQNARNNRDVLHRLTVSLTFETQTGSPVLVDGHFGFHRESIKTDRTDWDPGRLPASPPDWVIANQIPFSMKLEKSP